MDGDGTKSKSLSVIALHRRLGPSSMAQLKEKVTAFAREHTFKETAKAFGIHHSTVSEWVKAGDNNGNNVGKSSKVRADEAFLGWLREKREGEETLSVGEVRNKVDQIIQEFGGPEEIEKSCKWFLLWNNR